MDKNSNVNVPEAKSAELATDRKILRKIPAEYKAEFKRQQLETNVGRMYVFAIYIIFLQIALQLINVLRPGGDYQSEGGIVIPIMFYIVLSFVTLLIGIIYWLLLLFVRKGKITGQRTKSFLVYSLLYFYIIVELGFCTLNILAMGGMNAYIIAILILGMVPVIRPLQGFISIFTCFAINGVVMYLNRGVSATWDSVLLTDTWTNLIIITGLTVCISFFIYDMYVANFLKSIKLQKLNDELEIMANTDPMTGVANRQSMSRNFNNIWALSARSNLTLAVAIVDIDFFKAYNDTFGHLAGDKCLQQVAASLQASFRRDSDIVIRYGGEEFMIVYEANSVIAFELAEKARKSIEGLRLPHGRTDVSEFVTISIGVCLVQPSPEITSGDALKIADDALYYSKHTGRNRTTIWTPAEAAAAKLASTADTV
ncbi:MAG: GGDEF domain-containing protein [Oscillospiraceae bacterium]|jgi:diguanylate cyclase (GGDEF)-like protein|nr:GGDEF domain-containing protein [Oscillospiraceae bacterium]